MADISDKGLEEVLSRLGHNDPRPIRIDTAIRICIELDRSNPAYVKDGNNMGPVVTLYPSDKSAIFHGDYRETAENIPILNLLINYLKENNYRTNLD